MCTHTCARARAHTHTHTHTVFYIYIYMYNHCIFKVYYISHTKFINCNYLIFREFVKICYTALQINSKLITSDQHEYQEVLRENYQKLCQNLSSLLGEPIWPDEQVGNFKRNSAALFSAISGASNHTSTA